MTAGDTIAAISSATGPAARMIVRASGPLVGQIHAKLTGAEHFKASARRSKLVFDGLSIPAWVYCFAAPKSVTGEDVLELHIPGNPLLARMLSTELMSLGARQADPGEFTARAYFNGKISLPQAEGIAAVISAQSERELTAARQLRAGELARQLNPILDDLAQTLALVEAGIDFSEEAISFLTQREVAERIESADNALAHLFHQSSRFEKLSHEPHIVLAGRPNAGKSTLLNALAAQERAIVSPQAGTTRDAIWAIVQLPRGKVRMIDIAGLEQTSGNEVISGAMQQQARRAIEEADLIVLVRDCTDDNPPLDLRRMPDLHILTKIDLQPKPALQGRVELQISAKTGINLDQLRERLDALAFGKHDAGPTLALNARHVKAIQECRECLSRARDLRADISAEILAMEIRQSLDALGSVLGMVSPDDVLGRVFATFCIGK